MTKISRDLKWNVGLIGFIGLIGFALGIPLPCLAQRAVFIVRHAEMATDANEASVPLSAAGAARAQRLADLLKDAGISAVYSTDTVRTKTTAQPLATRIQREVRLYSATNAAGQPDLAPLAERLKHEHAADKVLVVGHSNTVGPLISALGCQESIAIAGDEYDNLFIVVPQGSGPPALLRLRY